MPTQGGMSRENQILTKYDKILTKYDKNDQIHVEKIQEHHFLEIKKQRKTTGEGDWVKGGLLKVLTHRL